MSSKTSVDLELQKQQEVELETITAKGGESSKAFNIEDPPVLSLESKQANDDVEQLINPRAWPRSKKWRAVAFASLYTFISPISSSMVAPALPDMARDLGIHTKIEIEMSLSIFVLAYAFGPLFLGPLSEIYGRYSILQASLWFFVIFNTACGLATTKDQMLVFRFLAGLGGSAPIALAGSVVSDCFNGAEMGAAMSYYALGVILGPALGPIIGGIMTQYTSWSWVFYVVSIAGGVLCLTGTFFLPETYAPLLKSRARAKGLLHEETPHEEPKVLSVLKNAIVRPFVMLGTQPIAQVIAVLMAFVYGIMYIVLSTFSALFVKKYHEETITSTLHYLALGIGFFIGNRMSGGVLDTISRYLQKRYNTPHKPEYRLPVCIPAAVVLPIGLFIYGWSAENAVHWIVPDIGIMLFSMSVNVTFQALTVYTVDVYMMYSASALAAVSSLRSLAGFGFPLFADNLYDQLGYGWGNSVLAFVGIVIGIPAPILLYVYGERIRARSKFGSG
ncbi:MFS multidrug transporter [Chytriomyces sp. MP71]|nr:MFS multidrug transporter [Chytriomyces sp. MP71]